MKVYLLSLGIGLLVGAFYAVVGVRAPAPPVIALIGLFGMYCGEEAVRAAKSWGGGGADTAAIAKRDPVQPAKSPTADNAPSAERRVDNGRSHQSGIARQETSEIHPATVRLNRSSAPSKRPNRISRLAPDESPA